MSWGSNARRRDAVTIGASHSGVNSITGSVICGQFYLVYVRCSATALQLEDDTVKYIVPIPDHPQYIVHIPSPITSLAWHIIFSHLVFWTLRYVIFPLNVVTVTANVITVTAVLLHHTYRPHGITVNFSPSSRKLRWLPRYYRFPRYRAIL